MNTDPQQQPIDLTGLSKLIQYSKDELLAYINKNRLLRSGADNVKLAKSDAIGEYLTFNLSLMPWKYSGFQTCPIGQDCHLDCIGHKSGNNVFRTTQIAKIKRTQAFFKIRPEFMRVLREDIEKIYYAPSPHSMAVRLNTYSDIPWEEYGIVDAYPGIMFYDYTKLFSRVSIRTYHRENYDLTYSLSAKRHNLEAIQDLNGHNRLAMVVSRPVYKSIRQTYLSGTDSFTYKGVTFYNGELHDLTFKYPKKGVLILKEKYVKTPQAPNPLVYRSLDQIGLS
jgi:hypothetical protein